MNFSPSTVLEKVSKNKDVSIEKCRQMAIIAGAEPKSFFDIRKHEKTALAIENKKELLSKLNKQAVISSSILSYVPATFKNAFTRKNVGGVNIKKNYGTLKVGTVTPRKRRTNGKGKTFLQLGTELGNYVTERTLETISNMGKRLQKIPGELETLATGDGKFKGKDWNHEEKNNKTSRVRNVSPETIREMQETERINRQQDKLFKEEQKKNEEIAAKAVVPYDPNSGKQLVPYDTN